MEEIAGKAWNPGFLCECAHTDCTETLEISLGEYESIRSSPVRFPIKPGHEFSEFERVVEENERYAVVEKFGEAAEVVRKLDPPLAGLEVFTLPGRHTGLVEGSIEDNVAALLAKRKAVAERPESEGRDAILQALDDMIVQLETGRWPGSIAQDD